MRVALINSVPPDEGIGRYAFTLQKVSNHQVTQFYIDKSETKLYRIPAGADTGELLYSQPDIPFDLDDRVADVVTLSSIYNLARKIPAHFDVYHIVDQNLANIGYFPHVTPVCLTVHDLAYRKLASTLRQRIGARMLYHGISSANAVISISKSTARDLQEHFDIPASQISVIYHGVDDIFRPASQQQIQGFAGRHGLELSATYLLHMGNNNTRKDIPTLLRTVRAVRERLDSEVYLLRTCSLGRYSDLADELNVAEYVIELPRIPDDSLHVLYSLAEVLVTTSTYEGFGFPPLEAMACGTPVVATNVSSLPEVIGEAGCLQSPGDVEGFTRAICSLLNNGDRRSELKQRGLDRVQRFDWEDCGNAADQVYDAVAESHHA